MSSLLIRHDIVSSLIILEVPADGSTIKLSVLLLASWLYLLSWFDLLSSQYYRPGKAYGPAICINFKQKDDVNNYPQDGVVNKLLVPVITIIEKLFSSILAFVFSIYGEIHEYFTLLHGICSLLVFVLPERENA